MIPPPSSLMNQSSTNSSTSSASSVTSSPVSTSTNGSSSSSSQHSSSASNLSSPPVAGAGVGEHTLPPVHSLAQMMPSQTVGANFLSPSQYQQVGEFLPPHLYAPHMHYMPYNPAIYHRPPPPPQSHAYSSSATNLFQPYMDSIKAENDSSESPSTISSASSVSTTPSSHHNFHHYHSHPHHPGYSLSYNHLTGLDQAQSHNNLCQTTSQYFFPPPPPPPPLQSSQPATNTYFHLPIASPNKEQI